MAFRFRSVNIIPNHCPICGNEIAPLSFRCTRCNRELTKDYLANPPYPLILCDQNIWLDSFKELCTIIPPLKGSRCVSIRDGDHLIPGIMSQDILYTDPFNFNVIAYKILLAWEQRDTSKRYFIRHECITRLQRLNFNKLRGTYLLHTL